MACDSPISIKFQEPIQLDNGSYQYYFPADCGKCLKCLTKRKAQWSFRMTEEKRQSFSSYFITLTYTDQALTWAGDEPTINKNDHFQFIKKLKELEKPKVLSQRKEISLQELRRKENGIKEEGKLKYYGCYEYGDQFGRPHAHYILFNVRDIHNIALAWSTKLDEIEPGVYDWDPMGKIDVDSDVNVNNIDYVLKYMVKDKYQGNNENKQREISFMSKGLGISVADDSFKSYISQRHTNQVLNQRGSKIPLPRYYRKKFLSEEQCNEKNKYIAEEIQSQQAKKESDYLRAGLNVDVIDLNGKKNRLNLLKSRSKRNLE